MQQTLDYLYQLEQFGIKLGLEQITALTSLLNNPQNAFKSIHLAGTNGKGSTSAFIAKILETAGYKVGLYTSPHLIKFNERIQINGQQITDKELVKLTKIIKRTATENQLNPTFFEFTTALAFLYFAQENVDFAVIETGLGGRLDATNIIQPLISIITNISFDHTQYLGNTLLEIAGEKAGIIKENNLVVTAETDKSVIKLFQEKCQEKNAQLFLVDQYLQSSTIISTLQHQNFITQGLIASEFEIKLLGEYQIKNALTAILTIDLLKKKGITLSLEHLKEGLKAAQWPGRLQILHQKPLILVDGSHNGAGVKTLKEFLINFAAELPHKKILIWGNSKDKEYQEMLSLIIPLVDEVIITKGNFKPMDPELIKEEVLKYTSNVKIKPLISSAIQEGLSSAQEDHLLIVAGSLYVVGDALIEFNKIFKSNKKM